MSIFRRIWRWLVGEAKPAAPTKPITSEWPPCANPECPVAEGLAQSASWKIKTYDGTYRIAVPTALAPALEDGRSYCTVSDGGPTYNALWRGWDTDNGARRGKYSLPLSTPLKPPVRVVVRKSDGTAIAWFVADNLTVWIGRLPRN